MTTPSNQSPITNPHSPSLPGVRLRTAIEEERPLQMVGTINAFSALLAERAGFRAIYLSGAGVANASFGLPDLGMTNLNDVCEDVRRITGVSVEEMRAAGIRIVLYPLSAFRAMSAAAESVYETIRHAGTQKSAVDAMQTRDHLYEVLKYHDYESRLDSFSKY